MLPKLILTMQWTSRSAARGTWSLLLILSQRLLAAQIDQYYEVSKDAFLDIVTYKCENHVTLSDTVMRCAPFCPMPGRRRCFAFATGQGNCWVCGEDTPGHLTAGHVSHVDKFWVHSGECIWKQKCTPLSADV